MSRGYPNRSRLDTPPTWVLHLLAMAICLLAAPGAAQTYPGGRAPTTSSGGETPAPADTPGTVAGQVQCDPRYDCCGNLIVGGVEGVSNSPSGSQTTEVSHPRPSDGTQGLALCYTSALVLTDPRKPGPFRRHEYVPLKGLNLFCPMPMSGDCFHPEMDCSHQVIDTTIYTNQVPSVQHQLVCVCGPVQVGGGEGITPGSAAHFSFTGQEANAQGFPIKFRSNKSGAELWWHYNRNLEQEYIEIKHVDGTVARYTNTGIENAEAKLQWWQLNWVKDPFDNKTTYHYYTDRRLRCIEYATGIYEHWNWSPDWLSAWTGHRGIEATYSTSSAANPSELPHLTWYMVFEDGGTNEYFFAGRLKRVYTQASKYVPDAAANALYDISQEGLGHIVTEFHYGGNGGESNDVTSVLQFREPFVPPAPSTPDPDATEIIRTYYSNNKVASHVAVQLGGATTQYVYDQQTTRTVQGVSLSCTKVINPDGHPTYFEFDTLTERLYRRRSEPAGSPRTGDPDGPVEPEKLWTDYYYDATCVCQKPSMTREYVPENGAPPQDPDDYRETNYEYNAANLLTKVTTRNPATGAGQPATISFETDYVQELNTGVYWSAWRVAERRTPDGITHFTYTYPIPRVDAEFHGTMPSVIERKVLAVRVQTGESSTSTADIKSYFYPNLVGSQHIESFSGSSTRPVQGGVRKVADAHNVVTEFEYNDWGMLSQLEKGTVQSTFVYDDIWGRIKNVFRNAASSSPALYTIEQGPQFQTYRSYSMSSGVLADSKTYYDRWGNVAVTLSNNLASDGQAPHKHGTTGSPRSWVRTEYHWQHSMLMEKRMDRRPVDEGDGAPLLGSSTALMAVMSYEYTNSGLPEYVRHPSGAETAYEYDGFGTPYKVKTRRIPGVDDDMLVSRYYVNNYLEPIRMVQGEGADKLSTTIERNGAGAVTAVNEPSFIVPSGYQGATSGARWEFSLDRLGRVIETRAIDGQNVIAQRITTYDQLSRVMKVVDAVLGQGSGTSWLANAYLPGSDVRLGFALRTGGKRQDYNYDMNGRLSSIVDDFSSGGNQVIYTYKASTDLLQKITRVDVEGAGSTTKTYETTYETDAFGQVISVKEGPAGSQLTHSYYYNSLGLVDQYTDPLGRVQKFLPDALGRLVEHVRVGDNNEFIRNRSVFFDYTGTNARTKVERYDGLEHLTATHFDFAGRPFIVQNPGAPSTEPTPTTPQPFSSLAIYNQLSRVTDVYDGDGGHTILRHDGAGRLIWRELLNDVEAISHVNTKDVLKRDKLGRIVQTDLWGVSSIDGNGNLVNNGLVGVEAFLQDSLGRTHEEAYVFALASQNILRVQSTYSGGDPFRTGLNYVDSLTGGNAQPLSMQYTPDAIGRLSQVDWNRTPGSGSMVPLANYTWVGGLRKTRSVHYTSTEHGNTGYQYDNYGRLTQILDQNVVDGGATTTFSQFDYEYDAAGNLKKEKYAKVGGRVGDRFLYDAYHRLLEAYMGVDTNTMENLSDSQLTALSYSSSQVLAKLTYGIDVANNRTQTTRQTSSQTPVPDIYTLQGSSPPPGPSNRYHTVGPQSGPVTMTYDNRGNMTYDGNYYYEYDYLSRLQEVWSIDVEGEEEGESYGVVQGETALTNAKQQVTTAIPGLLRRFLNENADPAFRGRVRARIVGGVLRYRPQASRTSTTQTLTVPEEGELVLHAVYAYDAFNRRIMRALSDGNTYFHTYDGWREVVEYIGVVGQAVPNKEFVWGSRLDEMVAYRRKAGTVWEDYYVHHGGQDTAARLVDANGDVVEKYEYDAYGQASVYTGSNTYIGGLSAKGLPFLWKSIRVDSETGLLYMRNRYYSTSLGRFITADPLGTWGDFANQGNSYAYVHNSPNVFRDSLGLQGESSPVGFELYDDNVYRGTIWETGNVPRLVEMPREFSEVPITKKDGRWIKTARIPNSILKDMYAHPCDPGKAKPKDTTKLDNIDKAADYLDIASTVLGIGAAVMSAPVGPVLGILAWAAGAAGAAGHAANGDCEGIAWELAGVAGDIVGRIRRGTKAVGHHWTGPRIDSGIAQEGVKDSLEEIKRDMLAGTFRFGAKEGRIGGWLDDTGGYHLGEGHTRMAAAMEIFEETGDAKYVDELLKNGLWTPGSPPSPGPLPRR